MEIKSAIEPTFPIKQKGKKQKKMVIPLEGLLSGISHFNNLEMHFQDPPIPYIMTQEFQSSAPPSIYSREFIPITRAMYEVMYQSEIKI